MTSSRLSLPITFVSSLTASLLTALSVVLFTLALWYFRGEPGIVWDEPFGIRRQESIRRWCELAFRSSESRAKAFTRETLEWGWPFAHEAPDEHPPVYALLSLLTFEVFEPIFGPLSSHRLAPLFLFAVTVGVATQYVRARFGDLAGFVTFTSFVGNPRIFTEAQLATTDMTVSCFWLLAVIAFLISVETGKRTWLFGILAGLCVMSKVIGVLVLPTMLLGSLFLRRKATLRVWLWSVITVPLVMWASHPGWWLDPIGGVTRWVRAFLKYPQKVPIFYAGEVIGSLQDRIPWHQTFVLLWATLHLTTVLLAALSLVLFVSRSDSKCRVNSLCPREITFVFWLNGGILLALRVMGLAPTHDGDRQLLPTLLFFCPLAGIASSWLRDCWANWRSPLPMLGDWMLVLISAACLVTSAWHQPLGLNYFSGAVGGPAGAKELGLERTYYWDVADEKAYAYMNANLPAGATVVIIPGPDVQVFAYAQKFGKLRPDLVFVDELSKTHVDAMRRLDAGDANTFAIVLFREGLLARYAKWWGEPRISEFFLELEKKPALFEVKSRWGDVKLLGLFAAKDLARDQRHRSPNAP